MLASILDPLHGAGYQFWSGIAGCTFLVTWLLVYVRHHNCHVKGCPRLIWKHTAAGDLVCRKHHPEGLKTYTEVVIDHHKEKKDNNSTMKGDK